MPRRRKRQIVLPHEFRIGVYAPYGWDGVTHMAVAAADTIHGFGFPVSYFPVSDETRNGNFGLYPRWDGRVTSPRRPSFEEWIRPLTHVLWFAADPEHLELSVHVYKKNILVATPERTLRRPCPAFAECDYVLAPSTRYLPQARLAAPGVPAVALAWDAALPLRDRALRRVEPGWTRLFVFLDRKGTQDWGDEALSVVLALLADNPRLRVTFACCNPSPELALRLQEASQALPDFLSVIDRPSAWDRFRLAPLHDWTWLLCGDSGSGSFASEFLSAGRLLLSFDAAPVNENVRDRVHGRLLSCRAETVSHLWPRWESVLEEAEDAICRPQTFLECLAYPWSDVECRKRRFQEAWGTVLLAV